MALRMRHHLAVAMNVAEEQPDPWDLIGVPMMLGPEDLGLHTVPGTAMDPDVGSHHLSGAGFVPDDPDLGECVVLELLAPSTTTSTCAYKGVAS